MTTWPALDMGRSRAARVRFLSSGIIPARTADNFSLVA